MANNLPIDYVPNRNLYVVIRNNIGQVWHCKRHRWVEWKDEDIPSYITDFVYKCGDRYVATMPVIPKPLRNKEDNFQIFEQRKTKPSNRDILIGNTTKLKVKEYPNVKEVNDSKHVGFTPGPPLTRT